MTERSNVCGYCGKKQAEEPRQQCLDCIGLSFHCDAEAEAHYRLTGHPVGWPITSGDWEEAGVTSDG